MRRAHRANPLARLVVSGCLASLEAADLARESGVDLVVGNQDKDRLVEIAAAALSLPIMPELAIVGSANPLFARGRQRVELLVHIVEIGRILRAAGIVALRLRERLRRQRLNLHQRHEQ